MSWTTTPVVRPRPKVRGWIARVQIAAQAQGVGIASALTAVSGSTATALGVGTPSGSLTVRGLAGASTGVGSAGASSVAVLRALADAEGLAAVVAAQAVLAEAAGVGATNAATAVLASAAVTGSGIAEAATAVRGVLADAAGHGAASATAALGSLAATGDALGVGTVDAAAVTKLVAAATGAGTATAATFVRAVLAEAVATGTADASLIPTLAADTVGDGAADATAAEVALAEIEFVSREGTDGTSVPISTVHEAGDMIIMFVFRDGSTTPPSLPSGWTNIHTVGANSCSARLAYKIAQSSAETSGTWTNGSVLAYVIYRNADGPGAVASATGVWSTTITYPALTLQNQDGRSWVAGFVGHRSTDGSVATRPQGTVGRGSYGSSVSDFSVWDSGGPTGDRTETTVTLSSPETSSGAISMCLEIRPQ